MPLFKSRLGDVACAEHAPLSDVSRWTVQGWRRLRPEAVTSGARCGQCSERGVNDASKPLILNVDDRPAQLYARARELEHRGFAVVNARTGADAFTTALRVHPSLILLDIHLTDSDGRDVCRRIKGEKELAGVPVVLISSTLKGHVDNLESVRWGGADGYVTEPCDPAALESTLRKLIPT
jgi:CheY-like chemotaxis protein